VALQRLLTTADLDATAGDDRGLAVRARLEAVLRDGRRLLLLDDRGWAVSGAWVALTPREVEETTRIVVGPDEPAAGSTWEQAQADHWAHLAGVLREQRVSVDAAELRRLPHDVVLTPRLRARLRC
jgi:hypothetical protein